MPKDLPRWLLWIDGSGGLAVGVAVILLREWLSGWYGLPVGLLTVMAFANFAYGTYSLSLAARSERPKPLIKLLVVANLAWAVVCLVLAARWVGTASGLGLAHLLLEGAYVGGLGGLEWRCRERLRHRR